MTLVLLLSLVPLQVWAEDPVVLHDGQDFYDLDGHAALLEDSGKNWTIDDVRSAEIARRFQDVDTPVIRLGFTSSAYWLRVRLSDTSRAGRRWCFWVRPATLDYLDFYVDRPGQDLYRARRTGEALPFSSRDVSDFAFLFNLPWSSGEPAGASASTIYLRVESSQPISLQANLVTSKEHLRRSQRNQMLLGLFSGIMALAVMAHLFVFLLTRESSYLYYVLVMSTAVAAMLYSEGFVQQHLLPPDVVLPRGTLTPAAAISTLFLLRLGVAFLDTQRRLPGLHRAMLVLQVVLGLALLSFPILPLPVAAAIYFPLVLLSLPFVVGAGLLVAWQGYRPARYFSFAWLVLIGAYLAAVFIGRISLGGNESFVAYVSIYVGFVLTTLVFALALADRVRMQGEDAAAEREHLIQELEARNQELERFTYTVSHDLKSPLVTIQGFLGLLKNDAAQGDAEKVLEDARHISGAADQMGTFLEGLLELSRIGRVVGPTEEVELGSLVREALDLLAGQVAQRGVEVVVAADMPRLYADRLRLRQVFQNLVENAVKFLGEQEAPRLEIGAKEEGDDVLCYVRDNGIGIEPEDQQRIFAVFEKLQESQDGSGVGLATVRRIVESHGGEIWVESKGRGRGSTFWMRLPRHAPAAGSQA